MRIVNCIICFLFLCSCSALAGELDTFYLQRFGELPTDAFSPVLKSSQTTTAQKCGMPLHHDLKRAWSRLEPGTQKTLAKYLEKPVLANERIFTSSANHFRIHYASTGTDAPPSTDNNANGIPDWIETVGTVFEGVYTREITQMGYTAPPGGPYNVYLKNMSYFGLTDSDILNGQSATSYITIENDFAEHVFQASIPGNDTSDIKSMKALQITAAHELHHAIQYGYNYYFEAWYAEATASWMEDEVYDSVNQLYNYLGTYLSDTATSLNFSDGYDRWIFNRFLYEKFNSQDMILRLWNSFASEQSSGGADIPMLPFIDKVIRTQGSTLSSSFYGFAKQVYLRNWSSHTDEISRIPSYTPTTTYSSYPVNSSSLPQPVANLPAYSFAYYRLTPGSSAPASLNITFGPSGAFSITAFKKTTGGIVTEYPLTTVGGTLAIDAFNVAGVSEVALLICNSSPYSGSVSFSTDGTVQVVMPTVSGSSNHCFIATAAYGSSLHPEVMMLRSFRDRYLLTNAPGRAFVSFYYKTSPPIADFIRGHESARHVVRGLLTPIIFALKHLFAVFATASILSLLACIKAGKTLAIKFNSVTENR